MSAPFAVRQEDDAVEGRPILRTAVGLVFVGVIGIVGASALLVATTGALRPSATGTTPPTIAPRTLSGVEQTPIRTTRYGLDLQERQRQELDRWGWVDRDGGVAEIPIGRAIDVLLAHQGDGGRAAGAEREAQPGAEP